MASEAQVIGGHKANLHNPNTSAEAKEHSKEVLKEDFNGKQGYLSRPLKPASNCYNLPAHEICLSEC